MKKRKWNQHPEITLKSILKEDDAHEYEYERMSPMIKALSRSFRNTKECLGFKRIKMDYAISKQRIKIITKNGRFPMRFKRRK